MSVFTPIRNLQAKVHHSQYLKSEDTPGEGDTKPAEPATPDQPEAS